jgi:hypothetical protein
MTGLGMRKEIADRGFIDVSYEYASTFKGNFKRFLKRHSMKIVNDYKTFCMYRVSLIR